MAGVEFGKSVYVPSEGWIVFGRLGNSLNTSQKLTSLDSDWKAGPAQLQGYHKEAQCLVQVKLEFQDRKPISVLNRLTLLLTYLHS